MYMNIGAHSCVCVICMLTFDFCFSISKRGLFTKGRFRNSTCRIINITITRSTRSRIITITSAITIISITITTIIAYTFSFPSKLILSDLRRCRRRRRRRRRCFTAWYC